MHNRAILRDTVSCALQAVALRQPLVRLNKEDSQARMVLPCGLFAFGGRMFGMFESLAKAAVGVVTVPVAAVADVVTMGGALTDKDKPYTAEAVSDVLKNLENAIDPRK